jgi:hypothetical protein
MDALRAKPERGPGVENSDGVVARDATIFAYHVRISLEKLDLSGKTYPKIYPNSIDTGNPRLNRIPLCRLYARPGFRQFCT